MTLVMGILNVTPDSFSDGGAYLDADVAITHARAMLAAGASMIDVGGESTRPGSARVGLREELGRVVPIVAALAADGITVSVDTMRAKVASAAIDAGARIINDVSGGLADPDMLGVVAQSSADFVLMHWRDHSARFQSTAQYGDVVADVLGELLGQRDKALEAGIPEGRIILDPGLGFSKTWDHNWTLLRHLDRFQGLGHRVLVGASRKAFLGELLGGREPLGRDGATAAVSFWSALHGVWAVRTHDVGGQADAIAVARRLDREAPLGKEVR
ncbi:dihydropteroate synthase [Tessaracoccus sp. Y36]|uniref:dihydropteroate synthase n=1 Tax=Tessaracoccus sp. MC1865 TaxID=2760310 RepID=UPI001FD8044A|nr:dihydropteroate synthase [Tessaracoccus sp. MC1865]